MSPVVLIPARLASTRLPNKPLADIGGVPMVVRVAQRVIRGVGCDVVVAADSPVIVDACAALDVRAILTRADHASGTDRLAEACDLLGLHDDAVVVNVQGDEPLIDPALVGAVSDLLESTAASVSTAACVVASLEEFWDPNVVKVVVDANDTALYFSRAPIAYPRQHADRLLPQPAPLRHIGIYGYRVGFLRRFPRLEPAPIERTESLEQLRALWHGYRIAVHVTANVPGPSVDTPEDLEKVRRLCGWQHPTDDPLGRG